MIRPSNIHSGPKLSEEFRHDKWETTLGTRPKALRDRTTAGTECLYSTDATRRLLLKMFSFPLTQHIIFSPIDICWCGWGLNVDGGILREVHDLEMTAQLRIERHATDCWGECPQLPSLFSFNPVYALGCG